MEASSRLAGLAHSEAGSNPESIPVWRDETVSPGARCYQAGRSIGRGHLGDEESGREGHRVQRFKVSFVLAFWIGAVLETYDLGVFGKPNWFEIPLE